MTVHGADPARSVISVSATVAIGILVALVSVLALILAGPVPVGFVLGGLVLLIPSFVVRDAKAYGLFVLVLSIISPISKSMTSWLVDPWTLMEQYGPTGTLGLDLFLSDIALFALMLPWLARLCLRQDRFYFPKVGNIFLLFLAWASLVSLLEAQSLYLSIFQWLRLVLYFIYFVYLVNNVVTRSQFWAIILALLTGLVIQCTVEIVLFQLDIGPETFIFSGVYPEHADRPQRGPEMYAESTFSGVHTRRSGGILGVPAVAAYYLEFILPIVLAYLMAARRARERILFLALSGVGWVALYLTFSRAGLVGLVAGSGVSLFAARASHLISRRAFALSILVCSVAAALSGPLLINFLEARPQPFFRRLDFIEITLDAYWQRPIVPIIGVGLNNSSALIKEKVENLSDRPGQRGSAQSIHNQYLVILTEVGLVGFLLFYAFFWKIMGIALLSMRAADNETKTMLVGIVGSLASVAVHNLGDGLAGHASSAMLWFYAGWTIAIAHRIQVKQQALGTILRRERS